MQAETVKHLFFHSVKLLGYEILFLEMHKPHKYQMLCSLAFKELLH